MSRRGDGIRKRKDGRWEGRYKKGRRPDGTIQYGSVYGRSYREVKDKLSEKRIELSDNIWTKSNHTTFGDLLKMWMDNNQIRLKKSTINKYQNLIDTHIMPNLGNIELSSLSASIINNFLNDKLTNGRLDKKGGLSSSYVRSIMLVINAAIKYAVSEQMCLPLKTPILKPGNSKKEITILSIDEQHRLEKNLRYSIDPTKVGVLISLYTGLRIGEVCALSWKDIDFHNRIIKIRHTIARIKSEDGKNRKTEIIIDTPKTPSSSRDIPIPTLLLSLLQQMYEYSSSEYVVSDSRSFTSPRTYEYRYHKILDESGVASVNYHALRHTFATRCIEAGMDVKSLSEILGHANVSITLNTYVHSSIEMKRSQLEKLTSVARG